MYFCLASPTPGVDLNNILCPQMSMNPYQYSSQPGSVIGDNLILSCSWTKLLSIIKGRISVIGDTNNVVRDFGSVTQKSRVIAEALCHTYTSPKGNEWQSWKKGSIIRVDDYSTVPGRFPSKIAMSLASDITNVARIDLDITVNLLDEDFGFEIWWFMVSSNRVSWVLLFEEISETGDLTSDVVVNAMSEHISIAWFHQKIDSKSELIVVEAQPEVVCRRYTV